ncbi:MAG TPA: phosphoribosylamine--glycine ligase [Acidobacteriota bacterium]|nr:phosphoribosylamine--glycine ligase [Acidobacteriota bacterium]
MKVLLVGSGGREHTLAWKLSQSPRLDKLYCAPGNAGTSSLAENVALGADDVDGLLDFARQESIDLTVVGPEAPLVAGIADRFRDAGQAVAGPSAAAAELEGSKAFAKDFMQRHAIPSARYQLFDQAGQAAQAIEKGEFGYPVVVKASGLAAGKGVLICRDRTAALEAVDSIMCEKRFGAAGDQIVIEEFLEGEEASFMVFTDGRILLPMVPSQDHKAAYDNDEGPNTGGMGGYSDDGILSRELKERVMETVMKPAVLGMAMEGRPFQGVLYAGLMLTPQGPKVLEFNVRFGDPETQAVLPRLKSDLLDVYQAVAQGDLSQTSLQWDERACVCVVLAAEGYPGSYPKGMKISGLDLAAESAHTMVFHAGTARDDEGHVVTSGGRVLGVTALGDDLESAILRAYEGVNKVHFENMHYRRDIGAKGLARHP